MYLTGGAKFKTADTILAGFNDRSAPQSGLRRTKTKDKVKRKNKATRINRRKRYIGSKKVKEG